MLTVQQLAQLLGVPFSAHGERNLHGVNSLEEAREGELAICTADKYLPQFAATKASCVLVGKKVKLVPRDDVAVLIVPDPDLALIKALQTIAPPIPHPQAGVDKTASISLTAQIGDGACIGKNVVIGDRTKVGNNARIHPGVIIGDEVVIGDNCIIYPNVVIRERITIGNRVIINAGSVIGTDGFGYKWDGKQHAKIPQVGTVVIEDDVEIGSCTCIDRAKFNETRIGRGTKIDNLVQVGHNVRIGMLSIICGNVAIGGTAKLGNGVVIGGASAIADHVTIADGVMAGGHTLFMYDVENKDIVSGWPAMPHRKRLREIAVMKQLPDLLTEVQKLRAEIDELKSKMPK